MKTVSADNKYTGESSLDVCKYDTWKKGMSHFKHWMENKETGKQEIKNWSDSITTGKDVQKFIHNYKNRIDTGVNEGEKCDVGRAMTDAIETFETECPITGGDKKELEREIQESYEDKCNSKT